MKIDEILPFEPDIPKTVDHFCNQIISIASVDLGKLIE